MSELTERTNEADIAAVTEVVLAYYDGMMAGDEVRLTRAFHPRACIVGNYQGPLEWQTLEEFSQSARGRHVTRDPHQWRIDGLSFQGTRRWSGSVTYLRASGTATIYPSSGSTASWRIVHKTWYLHPTEAAGTP